MQNDNLDEKTLVEEIKKGNEEAIRKFFLEYRDKVFRLSLQYVKREDEAYDLSQEVFKTLIEKIHNFREESKLSTWLYSVTVFTAISYLRKKKKETSLEELSQNNQSKQDSLIDKYSSKKKSENENPIEESLLNREAKKNLMEAIHNLPEDYKTIFILKELEGLSIKEIQKIVDISIPAIKTRLHRARLHLREKLKDYFYEMKTSK